MSSLYWFLSGVGVAAIIAATFFIFRQRQKPLEKKIEEKFRLEYQRLLEFQEVVIETTQLGVAVLNEKLEVVIWNEASQRISGLSEEQVSRYPELLSRMISSEDVRQAN